MLKRQISLKLYVALVFLLLMAILVAGYSLLSARFFVLGMDSVTSGTMHEVLKSYVQTVPETERSLLNSFSGYQIARQWEQLPEGIRATFSPPELDNTLLKSRPPKHSDHHRHLYFVMRSAVGNQEYYICRTLTHEDVNPLIGKQAHQSMEFLLVLSISIAALFILLLWLLLKQVSRPVGKLGNWARELNETNLNEPTPDFSYPELNELATLIQNSLSSVHESLEREQKFLRHSSHELRTPIAVIRNNIELLYKIQKKLETSPDPRQVQVVERIDRASLTMKHLTETLLWLGRDSQEQLPCQRIDLDLLLHELSAELRYLLKDKPVELILDINPAVITVPQIPLQIVLSNLIRNAFQHCFQGTVTIEQHLGHITITNPIAAGTSETTDLGFGLGLQLTEQLVAKMSWSYRNYVEEGMNVVEIELDSPV